MLGSGVALDMGRMYILDMYILVVGNLVFACGQVFTAQPGSSRGALELLPGSLHKVVVCGRHVNCPE